MGGKYHVQNAPKVCQFSMTFIFTMTDEMTNEEVPMLSTEKKVTNEYRWALLVTQIPFEAKW